MSRESIEPVTAVRNQYLNVVYFVESAKTHTLRINLRHARWAIAGSAMLFIWSLASLAWVILLESQVRGTRDHLATSLTALFAYQVKTDKIFDAAYPSDATTNYYSASAQLPSNNPIIDSKSTIEKIPVSEVPPASALATVSQHNEAASEPPTATTKSSQASASTEASDAKAIDPETLIKISDAKASIGGNKISIDFNITNPNKTKAEGYVWAVAKINRPGQPPVYAAAPSYTKMNPSSGAISQISTAYRFSIKSFKSKVFDIIVPGTTAWTVADVVIHFSDLSGSSDKQLAVAIEPPGTEATPGNTVTAPDQTPQ